MRPASLANVTLTPGVSSACPITTARAPRGAPFGMTSVAVCPRAGSVAMPKQAKIARKIRDRYRLDMKLPLLCVRHGHDERSARRHMLFDTVFERGPDCCYSIAFID